MNILKILVLLVLLTGCASPFKPGAGSYGDAASTFYALEYADLVEANPVLSWANPVGSGIASIGVKWGGKHFIHDGMGVDAYTSDVVVETAGVAATGWNIALILGASNPVGLVMAISSGWMYYEYRDNNREHPRYERLHQ